MRWLATALALFLAACPSPAPSPRDAGAPPGGDAGDCPNPPAFVEDVSSCPPLPTDYQPRASGSALDSWPACISDDGVYHPLDPNISSVARVAAFEQIAGLLWDAGKLPSAQDFLDARVVYAADQGLDSRVQRREDVHYPKGAGACSDPAVADANPDRCAGPKRLLPILNEAFAAGSTGHAPLVNAARIEAALTWFLYLSALSEAESCASKPQDCDSCWAYYAGGAPRESPAGLARLVRRLGPETHDRAYDGTLAVRCWRDLDPATPATDLALRDQARDQLDRALLRGLALLVRQRFSELSCASAEGFEARQAFLGVLVPLLDRAARARDAALADQLAAQLSPRPDAARAVAALDALFPCP